MNVNYPNGFVVLPVGEYNKMKEVIDAQQRTLDELVSIKKSYTEATIDVSVNEDTLYSLAVCRFEENADFVNNYNMVDKCCFSVWGTSIAHIKRAEEPVEDLIESEE